MTIYEIIGLIGIFTVATGLLVLSWVAITKKPKIN